MHENRHMLKGHVEGYVDSVLGSGSDERQESAEAAASFESLRPEEQHDVLFRIQSLVAERRDLVRTMGHSEAGAGVNDHPEPQPFEDDVIPGEHDVPMTQDAEDTAFLGSLCTVRRLPGGGFVPIAVAKPEQLASSERELVGSIATASAWSAEQRLAEIDQQLETLGTMPGVREAYGRKTTELYIHVRLMRRAEELEGEIVGLRHWLESVRAEGRASDAGAPVGVGAHQITLVERELAAREELLQTLENKVSVGPYLTRLRTLDEYVAAMQQDRMVEIPSVQHIVDDGLEKIGHGMPYMLAGHLGSGKTEVARHIARKHMLMHSGDPNAQYEDMEPEFFSGAEEASVYDLIGKLKLVPSEALTADRIATHVEEQLALLEGTGKFEELAQARGVSVDEYRATLREELTRRALTPGNATVTDFAYGPLGRAIKHNKPIIIDEINQVPPDVVARINDVLLKRPGDKLRLQENGEEEFEVGDAFAVLSTLNVGKQYKGVKDFNAAFQSRWLGLEIDYPEVSETFDLMLSMLMRKDRLHLDPAFPAEEYPRLVDLAVAVRELQELFSGQSIGQRFMSKGEYVRADRAALEKNVVSTRDVVRKIIGEWRNGGYARSLDEIIARNVLASVAISSRDEQQFMTEVFIRRGFFVGWDAARFEACGVRTVNDENIKTLQAIMETDEYKTAEEATVAKQSGARDRATNIRDTLLIGNQGLIRSW